MLSLKCVKQDNWLELHGAVQ